MPHRINYTRKALKNQHFFIFLFNFFAEHIYFTMNSFLSDINPSTFSLSAIAIGYVLSEDLNPSEQNSIGNWFMLIGQVLCTNAAQQQVINNNGHSQNGQSNPNNSNNTNIVNDLNMDTIKRTVGIMNNEVRKF